MIDGRKPYLRRSGPDRTIDGATVTPRVLMHPCMAEGCEKDGSFGFKVNVRRGEAGEWYCLDHRHLGERLYQSSTHARDDGVKGEPHEQHPPADDPADGA